MSDLSYFPWVHDGHGQFSEFQVTGTTWKSKDSFALDTHINLKSSVLPLDIIRFDMFCSRFDP